MLDAKRRTKACLRPVPDRAPPPSRRTVGGRPPRLGLLGPAPAPGRTPRTCSSGAAAPSSRGLRPAGSEAAQNRSRRGAALAHAHCPDLRPSESVKESNTAHTGTAWAVVVVPTPKSPNPATPPPPNTPKHPPTALGRMRRATGRRGPSCMSKACRGPAGRAAIRPSMPSGGASQGVVATPPRLRARRAGGRGPESSSRSSSSAEARSGPRAAASRGRRRRATAARRKGSKPMRVSGGKGVRNRGGRLPVAPSSPQLQLP